MALFWAGVAPLRAEVAGREEANIAKVTASLLERSNFAALRAKENISSRFFDRYLEALDGAKMYLLESDVADFAKYRSSLEELTLRNGDTSPAQKIFKRFIQRLEQRVAFVQEALQKETFDFSADEMYSLDREHAARPKDIAAAEQLWHQHLRYEYLQEKLSKKPAKEIVATLSKRYERTLKTMKKLHDDQVFELYLTSLAHVYDPHSDYMGPRQLEDFQISMSLSLFGIGAVLQSVDGYCKIHELIAGGPAAASKLIKPGDKIVTVAQDGKEPVDIVEMPLPDAVQLIRGPKGTKVTLTLIPAGADSSVRKTLTLVRDEIKLESQEAKARVVDLPRPGGAPLRIGVIDLPSFYTGAESKDGRNGHNGCTADMVKLIDKLKQEKIAGLVLDLRRNGGGSLEEAIRLTGLFIKTGAVVQTKDADGHIIIERDEDPSVQYNGPLVLLTSRVSASASEILAGALQDYERAVIVGDPSTFGKGTVQSMITLGPLMQKIGLDGGENPGALKLTIREFFRPSGASTQLKGVSSDLVLPSALAPLKIGEAEMRESLPWEKVPATPHDYLNRVAPYVATLKQKSAARVAADEEFRWLQEDVARLKEQVEHPVVSLNEKKRLAEKAAQETRDKARKQTRAKRPVPAQVQYEITVKNAAAPGLPAPLSATAIATNAAATADLTEAAPDEAEAAADDKNPPPDTTLEEGKRILADYIDLLNANAAKAVVETAKPATNSLTATTAPEAPATTAPAK